MSPAAFALAALVVAGCAARQPPSEPLEDEATALTRRLPQGLDGCVAGRLEGVQDAQRQALASMGQGRALASLEGVPLEAFARGERDGQVVFLIRLRSPVASLMLADSEGAERPLQLDERLLCDKAQCLPIEIDAPEPTLLRVRRGTLEPGPTAGAEDGCLASLAAHPAAVEVAARVVPPETHPSLPRVLAQRIEPLGEGTGLRVVRNERYLDAERAEAALAVAAMMAPEGDWAEAAAWRRRRAVGAVVRFEAEVYFADLALSAQDRGRVERARAAELRQVPLARARGKQLLR